MNTTVTSPDQPSVNDATAPTTPPSPPPISSFLPPRRGPGRPRKYPLELPNENPDREHRSLADLTATMLPVGIANLWHKNKYHATTYAMVIPFSGNEPGVQDWCKFLIRVDIGGAGSSVAVEGTEMVISDALAILNESYIQSRLTTHPY